MGKPWSEVVRCWYCNCFESKKNTFNKDMYTDDEQTRPICDACYEVGQEYEVNTNG